MNTCDQELVKDRIKITSLINDVQHLFNMPMRKTGTVVKVSDILSVAGTQRLLLRLFLNLISNAIKYQPPDQPPVIEMNPTDAMPGYVGNAVKDNGPGISPKYAEKIFQPPIRLHPSSKVDGTGLGLMI